MVFCILYFELLHPRKSVQLALQGRELTGEELDVGQGMQRVLSRRDRERLVGGVLHDELSSVAVVTQLRYVCSRDVALSLRGWPVADVGGALVERGVLPVRVEDQ